MVVAVHAGDQEWHSVHEQFGTDNLDSGEAGRDRNHLTHPPPRVDETHHHSVPVRVLVGPGGGSIDAHRGSRERSRVAIAVGLGRDVGGRVEHRHGGLARRAGNTPAAERLEVGSHGPSGDIAVDSARDSEIAVAE